MNRITAAVATAAGLALAMSAEPNPVRTTAGLVSGVAGRTPGITVFKGIPFAAPPVGPRRWRARSRPRRGRASAPRTHSHRAASRPSSPRGSRGPTSSWPTARSARTACIVNVWTPAAPARMRRGRCSSTSTAAPTSKARDGAGVRRRRTRLERAGRRHLQLPRRRARLPGAPRADQGVAAITRPAITGCSIRSRRCAGCTTTSRRSAATRSASPSPASRPGRGACTTSPRRRSRRALFHRAIVESGARRGGARPLATQEADGVRFAEAKGRASIAELPREAVAGRRDVPAARGRCASARCPTATRCRVTVPGRVRAGQAERRADADRRERGRGRRDAAADDDRSRRFERQARQRYGASGRRVPRALSGCDRRGGERRAERERARSWRARPSTSGRTTARRPRRRRPTPTSGITCCPGPTPSNTARSTPPRCPTCSTHSRCRAARSPRPITGSPTRCRRTGSTSPRRRSERQGTAGMARRSAAPTAQTMEVGEHSQPIPVAESQARIAFWRRFLTAR